jgi:hypothetical protein
MQVVYLQSALLSNFLCARNLTYRRPYERLKRDSKHQTSISKGTAHCMRRELQKLSTVYYAPVKKKKKQSHKLVLCLLSQAALNFFKKILISSDHFSFRVQKSTKALLSFS